MTDLREISCRFSCWGDCEKLEVEENKKQIVGKQITQKEEFLPTIFFLIFNF